MKHPALNAQALVDLIEGGAAHYKKTSRSYILFCPKCQRQKLYVEKTTGASKCFKCNRKNWANWILAKVYDRSPEELNEILYGVVTANTFLNNFNLDIPDFWGEEEKEDCLLPSPPDYPPKIIKGPSWLEIDDPRAHAGRHYLSKRGVPPEIARQYSLGFDVAKQRVLIPIVVEGEVRGWQARYIHATELADSSVGVIKIPKIITTGEVGGKCFMFQDNLKKGLQHAVLAEGPFDALKCHLIGGNIASMGKAVSMQQLDIIVRSNVKKLYIGLDRNAATEVGEIVKMMYDTLELYRLLPPEHRSDLGDCTYEEVAQQFNKAERLKLSHSHQIYISMPNLWVDNSFKKC